MNVYDTMKPMTDHLYSWLAEGHFRLTEFSPLTGESRIVVDRKNSIMYPSTYIAARGLTGLPNSAISHLDLAYNNGDTYPTDPYTISPSNSAFQVGSGSGVLRIPLTFPGTITSAEDGSWNLATFNILVNQPSSYIVTGSPSLGGTTDFFEAGLVCQTASNGSPSNITGDKLFARIAFERLAYNSLFNLTVSWGIKLTT